MTTYIFKRIFWAIVTLVVILFVLFLLLEFLPGSPFNDERLSVDQIAILREHYGLNKPFFEKAAIFFVNALKGDFGISYSIIKNQPVAGLVWSELGVSMRIGLQTMVIGSFLGMILGIIGVIAHNTWKDNAATIVSVIGVSVPSYVFALLLSYFVGYRLGWTDISYSIDKPYSSSILPTIALSMFVIAQVARFLRSELIEVLNSEYIQLARAKGVRSKQIIFKHGLRNALISVITIAGPLLVNLMTGSLVIEKVYGIPGIGSLLVNAIQVKDYNVIVMIAFVYSALYIAMNLIVDILYGVINPKIRVAKGGSS
ncbi:ABC transporter permease [Paenibacillus sp. R14(2021)]|uniref:ABC transporter permease n=1 Tax=Paenibacillus sp. R14(2021) TaxID=2859228 RepID=UPI001C61527C|nr:ABC transporter permease [Paenibacillus sp. R14(2021)]